MKITRQILLAGILPVFASTTSLAAPDTETKNVSASVTDPETDTRLASAWRASEIIGTTVKNATDEDIGDIQDLVVDFKSGKILAVVISSGGFLGIADTVSSVPTSVLRYDTTAKAFKTKLTKEQLQMAPRYKSTEKPDYSDSTVMAEMRKYRDSIGGDVTAADNTARNEVDAKEETVTPTDQGSSDSDMNSTKEIRVSVMKQDNLSFNAKNVKIITKEGHVTLRGVVESAAEREAIVAVAAQHVDKSKITNSITVK